MQLDVAGVALGSGLEIFDGVGKLLLAVVAEAQQGARLVVGGIGRERGSKSHGSGVEVALFELSETKIEFDRRKLGIERQSPFVGGSGFGIFLFLRENYAQAGEGRSVVGIALRSPRARRRQLQAASLAARARWRPPASATGRPS